MKLCCRPYRKHKRILSSVEVYFTTAVLQSTCGNCMECRIGCAACCIAPSISSEIPGMPGGKQAGERCFQLSVENRCLIFGKSERPAVCSSLRPEEEMCGSNFAAAMEKLAEWEKLTQPEEQQPKQLAS